jgi:hypothetical protein
MAEAAGNLGHPAVAIEILRCFGHAPTMIRRRARGRPSLRFSLPDNKHPEKKMLETIAVILVLLWLLGLVSSYTMGGLIHILLVVAVVVILIRLIQGRRAL